MCFIECLCNVIGSNIYDKEWGNNKGEKSEKPTWWKWENCGLLLLEGERGEIVFNAETKAMSSFPPWKKREGIFFAFEKRNGLWTIQLRAIEFHRINQKVIIIVKALFLYLKEGEGFACLFLERMGIASTPPLLWWCFFLVVINPMSASCFQTSEKYF